MPIKRTLSILACAALFAVPPAVFAQATTTSPMTGASPVPSAGHHHHHHRHHRTSLMHALQALNLTDAQKQQVATYRSQERQANQNADAPTKRANTARMRDQIMSVLTPDQKTQFQAEMQHGARTNSATMPTMPLAPGATASPDSQQ